MKRTNKRPIKLNGGIAIPIKKDMYLLKGRKHEQGGIDLGNVEAEGNEVVKQNPKSLKVFSRVDMFGDKSPAELILRGADENKVFNAQQKFKQINHLNDDGTKKYKMGGLKRNEDYGSKKKPYPSVNKKDFAGGNRSYPIPTKADAVDALRLAGLHGRSDIKAKAYAKYPELRKARVGGLYSLITNEGTRLRPFSTGKLPQAKLGTEKDESFFNKLGRFFKNATIGAAMAENPTVMQASGWEQDKKGNYKQRRSEGSDKLAEGIATASTFSPTNPANIVLRGVGKVANKTLSPIINKATKPIINKVNKAIKPTINKVSKNINETKSSTIKNINRFKDKVTTRTKAIKRLTNRKLNEQVPFKDENGKILFYQPRKETIKDYIDQAGFLGTGTTAYLTIAGTGFGHYDWIKHRRDIKKQIEENRAYPINNTILPPVLIRGKKRNKSNNKVNNVKDTVTINNQINNSISSAPEINTSTISEPNIDNNVNIKSTTNVPNETKPKTKEVRRKNTIKTNKVINRNNNIRKNVLKQNKEFVKELGKKLATEDLNLDIAKKNTKPVSVINTPSLNYDELSKRIRTIGKPKAYLGTYSRSRNKGQFTEGVEDYNDNSINKRGNYNIKTKNVRYDLSNKGQIHDTDIGYNIRRNPNVSVDNIKYNKSGSIIPINKENNFNTGDAISLAGNIGGGIINYLNNKSALKDMSYRPAPVPRYATKLKTNININPQLDKMRETSARYEKLVRDNTISSRAGIGRIQSNRLGTLGDYNKLRSDVENLETDLINKDRLNQQDIANKNIDDYNNWRRDKNTFDNTIIENKAENKSNLIGTINAGIQNTISNVEQRHKDNQTILAYMASHPNVNPRLLKAMGIDGITQEMIDNWDKANGYKK